MRLIDGDGVNLTLFERGQIDKRFKWGETIRYTPSEVQQIINEDMPTVDAVPVVRCGECKWWKTNYLWNGTERKVCVIEPYEPCRKSDDYCSRGERKGGDE